MKYINRHQLGLEQFLVRYSPAFRLENSPENYASLLLEQPLSLQLSICRDIQAAMHQLVTSEFQVRNIIPANVRDLGETQIPLTPTQVAPFFQWLQKLHRDNTVAIHRWDVELDRVGHRLGEDLVHSFRSLEQITFQRIRLEREEDCLILSSGNALWGEFRISFEGVTLPEEVEFPQCGYLFWVEGEVVEEGFTFRLLMDREFSDTIYGERLLQNRNWLELSVECRWAQVEFRTASYVQRALALGLSSWDTVRFCCYELIHKSTVLQVTQLEGEEVRLADVAQLFLCTGVLDEMRSHPPITFLTPMNLLENRYKIETTLRFLRRIWGEDGEYLCETFEEIAEAYEQQHRRKYQRALNKLADALEESIEDGGIRKLALPLLDAFREVTAGMSREYPFGKYVHSAEEALREFTVGQMEQYHFSGEWPNFYRERGNLVEFLSVVHQVAPFTRVDGNLYFTFAVQLARCPVTTDADGRHTINGIAPKKCRAADFQTDKGSRAHFAILGDDIDGQGCLFAYPLGKHPGEEYREVEQNMAKKLGDTLGLAIKSLDLIPIRDKKIAQRHREYLKKNHVFWKLCQKWSVLAVFLTVLFLLPGFYFWTGIAEILTFSIGAVLVAVAIVGLISWLGYRKKQRFFWNRDKI